MSVFVLLGLLWAAVLIPPALRARAERRAEFIESFRRQMGALGRNAATGQPAARRVAGRPHDPLYGAWARPASPAKRRRDILGGLLGAMIGSFLLGFVPWLQGVRLLLLVLAGLFVAYVALLAHSRHRALAARRAYRASAPDPVAVPSEGALAPALDASR